MTYPRVRLTVAAALFIGWLGYLLYLVVASRDTIVLSRPQFMTAEQWILAEVADDDGKPAEKVEVLEVFRSVRPVEAKNGQQIIVWNLPEAAKQGYQGPGKYILPLDTVRKTPKELLAKIQLVPPSPGYVPAFVNVQLWTPGQDVDRTANLASEILGVDREVAHKEIDRLIAAQARPVTLAKAVPREWAVEFKKQVEENGADVGLAGDNVRIYPWTPATKDQIDELLR